MNMNHPDFLIAHRIPVTTTAMAMATPRHTTHFETRKSNCLSKRDKSSAGRIDPRAVDVCAALNGRDEYYTTSSCAGRCFLYRGDGIKSWHRAGDEADGGSAGDGGRVGGEGAEGGGAGGGEAPGKLGFFRRYRVNHDLVRAPRRYFDLATLAGGEDPTGGGDLIPVVGQFDNGNNAGFKSKLDEAEMEHLESPVWLRFEPFILHVMCRSLKAASALMTLARPTFKNVGLTSWNNGGGGDENQNFEGGGSGQNQQCKGGGPRYLVAIWGDEGLDMPLSLPSSRGRGLFYNADDDGSAKNAEWLAQLVNERHARNWKKIDRFVEAIRSLGEEAVDVYCSNEIDGPMHGMDKVELADEDYNNHQDKCGHSKRASSGLPIPRSYDGEIFFPLFCRTIFDI